MHFLGCLLMHPPWSQVVCLTGLSSCLCVHECHLGFAIYLFHPPANPPLFQHQLIPFNLCQFVVRLLRPTCVFVFFLCDRLLTVNLLFTSDSDPASCSTCCPPATASSILTPLPAQLSYSSTPACPDQIIPSKHIHGDPSLVAPSFIHLQIIQWRVLTFLSVASFSGKLS